MQGFIKRYAAILDRFSYYSLWFAGTCLVGMVLIIAYVVFGRYILHSTPSWGEALSVTLMGWFIFFGAAVGVNERTHLGFDVLLYVVPKKARAVLFTISDIAVFAFGIGMLVYGTGLAVDTWDAIRPTLGIPDGARYVPLALGGLLVCLFSLKSLMLRFSGLGDAAETNRAEATPSS